MSVPPAPGGVLPSDADPIRAIARRDRAAFVALFDRYAGRVKAFAMHGGASAADADEIAQDVLVSVLRHAGDFDPDAAAASTWIFASARNRRIDAFRRSGPPRPRPGRADPAP